VEAFGKVSFAQAVLVYFIILTHLGLTTLGTRTVARDKGQIDRQVSNTLGLRLALTALSFLLLVVFALSFINTVDLRVLVILFGLTLFPNAFLLDWLFKGVERMEFVAAIEILRFLPYVVLLLFLVGGPGDILRIPILFLGSTVLAALATGLFFVREYRRFALSFDLRFWQKALISAMPFGLSIMALGVYHFIDTVLLGFLEGAGAVGWYSAAYRIVFFILGLGGLYFESLFPGLARCYKLSVNRLGSLLGVSIERTAFFVIPMAVGGTVLAQPLIGFLYGSEYQDSVVAFQILIWWSAVRIIGWNYGYCLMACDREKQYSLGLWIGAVLNVVLNLFLIPTFSTAGAAIAKLLAEFFILAFVFYQAGKFVPISVVPRIWKPAIASLFMAAFLLILDGSFLTRLVLGAVVYFLAFGLIPGAGRSYLAHFMQRIVLNREDTRNFHGSDES
jgi:O-antigen/teichoic acid export membrane protein